MVEFEKLALYKYWVTMETNYLVPKLQKGLHGQNTCELVL